MLEVNRIYQGDCLDVMKQMADNSIDAVVTDPPYELGFMGKKWDASGIAYNVELWKECLRVLKPGGHLLAFGGTRTYHRMTCAIEDAGFEIRDCIQWLYGCLDEATEVLTNNGWKKYFELSPEDEVLQWDSKTSELSWTRPSKIHTYPYEGKMYHFANRHTDQLLTPNHRVYGKFRRHSRSPKPDVFEVVEAQHIKQHWQKDLPVAGLYKGGKHVDESYAYLVGWWLTDAWAHQDGKACMLEWNIDSRKALLKGLLDGDGTYRDGQHCVVFWSKKKERLDLVQLLAMSLNYRTLIDYKKGCVHINPKTNTTQLQHRHTHDVVDYKGDVWCVTVPKGAFVVRRNGKVFITGNSGFPKSHDISKAIDKMMGVEREVVGSYKVGGNAAQSTKEKGGTYASNTNSIGVKPIDIDITVPSTKEAKQWEGWGTALKPAHEPICMARKPLSEKTVAENVLKWGTGGINIDESRVGGIDTRQKTGGAIEGSGWGTKGGAIAGSPLGRFPSNLIHDNSEEVRACFPETKPTKPHGGNGGKLDTQGMGWGFKRMPSELSDNGGNASRFFKSIIYQAKASKAERNAGCEDIGGNRHCTVKPIALMEYLINMVTRVGQVVLDPFMGSGTTGIACKNLGREFIGIEREQEYVDIAEARCKAWAEKEQAQLKIF